MSEPATLHVTALLACHDRRDLTVRCLTSLFRTSVTGLRLDAVVWLNDDVELSPSALMGIVHGLRHHPDAVLVGGLVAPDRPKLTYTGFHWGTAVDEVHRTRPDGTYRQVEGFHGNIVAVPRSVRLLVGPIDGTWPHNFGDLDDTRRLAANHVPALLLPHTIGTCRGHTVACLDPDRSAPRRLVAALGRKYWPVRANWRYHHRHGLSIRGGHFTGPYRRAWRGRPQDAGAKVTSQAENSAEVCTVPTSAWRSAESGIRRGATQPVGCSDISI